MAFIYKIVAAPLWHDAVARDLFAGAAIDLADGYIHLSDASQVKETAQRYFAGQADLLLVAFHAQAFGDALKWEVSRGGQLFPHVYGPLVPSRAAWAKRLPWTGSDFDFPPGWDA
jgi:uncharacterized protein (DUF952 family)